MSKKEKSGKVIEPEKSGKLESVDRENLQSLHSNNSSLKSECSSDSSSRDNTLQTGTTREAAREVSATSDPDSVHISTSTESSQRGMGFKTDESSVLMAERKQIAVLRRFEGRQDQLEADMRLALTFREEDEQSRDDIQRRGKVIEKPETAEASREWKVAQRRRKVPGKLEIAEASWTYGYLFQENDGSKDQRQQAEEKAKSEEEESRMAEEKAEREEESRIAEDKAKRKEEAPVLDIKTRRLPYLALSVE